ncbi:MAG: MFS transporter [Alphaproteobacteria bacterium]|nr:MAG: MFS transporter [Alphaproteobacteria bacterium]
MSGINRRDLIPIIGMISVVGIVFGLTGPLLNLLLERQDLTTRAIGLNGSMTALGTLVITPLVPKILARLGTTNFMQACLALIMCLFLLMKVWPSYESWLVMRFVMGGAIAGLFVVSETWINMIATNQNRGRILGIYAACLSAGFGSGPLLIEFTGIDGWAPFIAGAGLILVAMIVLKISNTTPPVLGHSEGGGVLRFLKASPLAIGAGLLYGALETGIFGLMPVFGVRIGLTEATAAQMLTAIAIGNIIFQFPIGWMADKFDPRKVLGFCAACGVLGGLSLATLSDSVNIWPILILWGGTITGLYTVGLTILGRQYGGLSLAGANAALVSAYGLGALVSPTTLGISMDINDPYGLPYALAAMCVVYLIALGAYWQKSLPQNASPGLD